jgi:Type I restriction-modification system methyltransferase subunit
MYLHGFPNPTIFEYDTLTYEDKWEDSFDVMLANPPFMTPKGGIKPHKRFSIQANRAEVLFVDYILEHLKLEGRADIIVPEGIIFQSANAYKSLRKMLIENGLLAVISLPPGVFNPYSGVKTSILIIDKSLAKKAKEILFVKIFNDGYDLGAQRRPIDKNDLPQAIIIIKSYQQALKEGKEFILDDTQKQIAHLVAKEKIAESGDYNLSGDRYKEVVNFANQKWPMVKLGEVCEIFNGVCFQSENM